MKHNGIVAASIGLGANLLLFLAKLYVGISSNSLAIYCDAINNLGDTFACIIAILGFLLAKKLNEIMAKRAQSLCTFVISIVITVTGLYFVYNGIERLLYPLPVSYSIKYVIVISATIAVKILMGVMYIYHNKKQDSTILKAMVLDSFLDCFVTLFALMSLLLVSKVNFAIDGIFAIITGAIISITAIKNIISESKYLITN